VLFLFAAVRLALLIVLNVCFEKLCAVGRGRMDGVVMSFYENNVSAWREASVEFAGNTIET